MIRTVLTDDRWARIWPSMPGRQGRSRTHGADDRLFAKTFLWIVRNGAGWRDIDLDCDD